MEYQVITNINHEHFLTEVNDAIKNGWTPIGGVAITYAGEDRHEPITIFAQAVTKPRQAETLPAPQWASDGIPPVPAEIIAAAEKITEYFKRHNIKTFAVGGIQNRFGA